MQSLFPVDISKGNVRIGMWTNYFIMQKEMKLLLLAIELKTVNLGWLLSKG